MGWGVSFGDLVDLGRKGESIYMGKTKRGGGRVTEICGGVVVVVVLAWDGIS